MTSTQQLKRMILLLAQTVDDIEDQLAIRRHCLTDLNAEHCPVVQRLQAELHHWQAEGRAASFALLISGISHREFMKFIKEIGR